MTILNKTGTALSLSPSAGAAFASCQRAWWYSYVKRLRGPSSPAAELGSAIHDVAEAYLKTGAIPDESSPEFNYWRMLEPGLLELPGEHAPGLGMPGWNVETWVDGLDLGPLPLKGKVDYWRFGDDGTLIIGDWKTTGHPWKYIKSPSSLAQFDQPLLYAAGIIAEAGTPARLDFQHINIATRGTPKACSVWAHDVPLDSVAEAVNYWSEQAVSMADLASVDNETEISPNINHCYAYGGCSHREYCPSSPENRNKPQVLLGTYNPETSDMTTSNASSRRAALLKKLGASKAPAPAADAPEQAPAPAADAPEQAPAPNEGPYDTRLANAVNALSGAASSVGVPATLLAKVAKDYNVPQDALSAALSPSSPEPAKTPSVTSPEAPVAPVAPESSTARPLVLVNCHTSIAGTPFLVWVADLLDAVEYTVGGHWSTVQYNEGAKLLYARLSEALRTGMSVPPVLLVDLSHPLASGVLGEIQRHTDALIIQGR